MLKIVPTCSYISRLALTYPDLPSHHQGRVPPPLGVDFGQNKRFQLQIMILIKKQTTTLDPGTPSIGYQQFFFTKNWSDLNCRHFIPTWGTVSLF